MAGEGQKPKKLDLTSNQAKQDLDRKASADQAKEAPDLRQSALETAQKAAATEISRANLDNGAKGAAIDQETQKYLNEYFAGAIDRFDRDPDGKISQKESDEFQAEMLKKTAAILADVKKDTEKVKKVEQAAAKVDQMKAEDVQKNLGEITDVSSQMDLRKSIDEFEKIQQQNTAFQQSIQNQITAIQEFGTKYQAFKEEQNGWAFVTYAAKKVFSDSISERQTKLNQDLEAAKSAAAATLTELAGKKVTLDRNAEAIKSAISQERQRIIKERDDKLAEIAAEKSSQNTDVAGKKQKHDEIAKTQKELEDRHEALTRKQANTADLQQAWTQAKASGQMEGQKKEIESSTKDAEAEMRALQILLDEPNLAPEGKTKIQAEMALVAARLERGKTGLKLADERIRTSHTITRQLSDEERSAAQELNSVDKYLNGQVKPSQESLAQNIGQMELLKVQYSTDSEEVKTIYKKRVEQVDKINEGVNEYVFASAVGRNKSIESLRKSTESLSSVTIESKSLWNPLNWVQCPLQGLANNFSSLAHSIDNNTGDLLQDTRDRFHNAKGFWDKAGWATAHGLTQVLGIATGFVSGGVDLGGGIFNMAAHPLDSLNGIGTLLGMNVKEGKFFDKETFTNSWGNLIRAVRGADEWEKGNYGTSIGKIAFNIASMLVGAGEGGAVSKAGDAAKLARTAELESALSKLAEGGGLGTDLAAALAKAEGFTAKLAELAKVDAALAQTTLSAARLAYLKTFARTIVVESVPQFAKNAYKAGAEKFGALAVTKAVAGSLAKSALAGAKAVGHGVRELFPRNVKNVFKSASELTAAGLKLESKFTPGAIGSVYGNLLYAPVGVIRAMGRVAMDIPNLWKTFRGEGLVAAYRAAKIGKAGEVITAESADFAKAREKIAEIIEKDSGLKGLAETNEYGLASAEAKARIQLLHDEPALAAAYSKVEKAGETIQAESKAIHQEALDKLQKIKNDPTLSSQSAATAQAETQLAAAIEQQQKLFKDLTGKRSPELARLEAEVGEARARYVEEGTQAGASRPPDSSTELAVQQRYDRLKEAAKNGDTTEFAKIKKEFGPVKPDSALGKHIDAIETKAPEIPGDFRKEYLEHQDALYRDYQRYNKAWAEGDEVARAGLKAAHPELDASFRQLDSRFNAIDHHNALTHDITAAKVKADLITGDVIKADMTPQQAADALSKRYHKYNSDSLGVTDREVPVDLKEVKLGGESYRVSVKANGQVRLIAEDGTFVQTSREFAAKMKPEMSTAGSLKAPIAAPSATATAIPSSTPTATPSATPASPDVLAAKKVLDLEHEFDLANQRLDQAKQVTVLKPHNTATLSDSLSNIPKNSTVAYGTNAPGGHWVEVTHLENGEFLVTEISNGKFASETKVFNPKLGVNAQTGETVLSGNIVGGGPYEYRNIQEVYKPPTYLTNPDAILPPANPSQIAKMEADLARIDTDLLAARKAIPSAPAVAPIPAIPEPAGYKNYQNLQQAHKDALAKQAKFEQPHTYTEADATNSVFRTPEQAKAFNDYFQKNSHHLSQSEVSDLTAELSKNPSLGKITDPEKLTKALETQTKSFAESTGAESRYSKASKAAESALADIETYQKTPGYEAIKDYESTKTSTPAATPTAIPTSTPAASTAPAATPTAIPPTQPSKAAKLQQTDAAIEAIKKDWAAKRAELSTAEQNLEMARETKARIELKNPNDPKLATLDSQIAAREARVTGLETTIGTIEADLTALRSDWRGALASRGGEKILNVITAPYHTKLVQNQINRIKFVAGLPKEAVLAFGRLLNVEGRAAATATVNFFINRGRKLNVFMQNFFQTNSNSENLLIPLGQISEEQFLIMAQLSKSRAATPAELADFSQLSIPQKLAVLEEGWKKLGQAELSKNDFYNANDTTYIGGKKSILTTTVDALSSQPNPTAADVTAALDQHFGPAMNDMGKSYDLTTNGITVHVAADGTRTYEGIDQWVAKSAESQSQSAAKAAPHRATQKSTASPDQTETPPISPPEDDVYS